MNLELVFWVGFIALLAIGLALSVKQVLDNKKLGELIAKRERLISEMLATLEAEKWKRAKYQEE